MNFSNHKLIEKQSYLVGGLEHEFYDFPYSGNVFIPTDELIGVGQPPSNSYSMDSEFKKTTKPQDATYSAWLRNPNHQLKTVVNIPWFIGFHPRWRPSLRLYGELICLFLCDQQKIVMGWNQFVYSYIPDMLKNALQYDLS